VSPDHRRVLLLASEPAAGDRLDHPHLHARQRLTHGDRAKWFQVVHGNRGASFREPVSIGDLNPQVVEELKGGRLHERAAHKQSAQFPTEGFVHLRQDLPA